MMASMVCIVLLNPCSNIYLSAMLGLIRWKVIIHAFMDGYSHFMTAIHASNNNWAATVHELFLDLVEVHGLPSCVCGDHGVENLIVAAHMEAVRGVACGSYIWGW
jgi:hypothetical protein